MLHMTTPTLCLTHTHTQSRWPLCSFLTLEVSGELLLVIYYSDCDTSVRHTAQREDVRHGAVWRPPPNDPSAKIHIGIDPFIWLSEVQSREVFC